MAGDYFTRFGTELEARPLDRGMLAGFAELVRALGAGPVADIGCGTGRVTAHLDGLGVSAFGIDLSPEMVALARRLYPGLRFEVGSMLGLELADGSLGGVLGWYSVIHIPDERLLEVFTEFRRVLAPGGYLQLGFQAGDEVMHRTEGLGHAISLDFHHREPDQVAEVLRQAGFEVRARLLREADLEGEFPEATRQGFVLARKPAAPGFGDDDVTKGTISD